LYIRDGIEVLIADIGDVEHAASKVFYLDMTIRLISPSSINGVFSCKI